jgi:Fe-S-cluster containining protein
VNFEYPATVRFRCAKCGICCGDTKDKIRRILLLKPEAEQIAKTTAQPISNFVIKNTNRTPYTYEMKRTKEDGKCVFLENNLCTIYPVRPLICRFYPFELKPAHNRKYKFLFTEECPGINKGQMLSEQFFINMFQLARTKHRQKGDPKAQADQ